MGCSSERHVRATLRAIAMAALTSAIAACSTASLPPPPMANYAREAKERFLVFFTSEDATLTEDARAVVAEAAAEVQGRSPRGIIVYGFADTIGPTPANVRLSRERARAVADAMVQAGVSSALISARGLGETSTIAPPSDLNPEGRRAEIVLLR